MIVLPRFIGMIINHDKDPYEPSGRPLGMCKLKLPMFGQLVYPCREIPTLAEEKSQVVLGIRNFSLGVGLYLPHFVGPGVFFNPLKKSGRGICGSA